ncbi:MAG: hypothetical protein ABII81_11490 [Pseudomonadota bacterium]
MNRNIQLIFAVVLGTASFAAFALDQHADTPQAGAPDTYATSPGAHLILNGGITYGGDTLVTVTYGDGSTGKVKAGSLAQVGVGVLVQMEDRPLAIQVTGNYHYDLEQGSNGSVLFYRYPVEAMAYYTGNERWRVGGGVRYVTGPTRTITLNGKFRVHYDNAFGLVGEAGYALTPNLWMNFRAVLEKYQPKEYSVNGVVTTNLSSSPSVKGNHLGVNFTYQF